MASLTRFIDLASQRKYPMLPVLIWLVTFLAFLAASVTLSVTVNPLFCFLIVVGILTSTLLADQYKSRYRVSYGQLCEPKMETHSPVYFEEKSTVYPPGHNFARGVTSEPCLCSRLYAVPRRSSSSPKLPARPESVSALPPPWLMPKRSGGDKLEESRQGCRNASPTYNNAIIYSVFGDAWPSNRALFAYKSSSGRGRKVTLAFPQFGGLKVEEGVCTTEQHGMAIKPDSVENELMGESLETSLLPATVGLKDDFGASEDLLNTTLTVLTDDASFHLPSNDEMGAELERIYQKDVVCLDRHPSEGFTLPSLRISTSKSTLTSHSLLYARSLSLGGPSSGTNATSPLLPLPSSNLTVALDASATNVNRTVSADASIDDKQDWKNTNAPRTSIWSPVSRSSSNGASEASIASSSDHQRQVVPVPQWVILEVENLDGNDSNDSLKTRSGTRSPDSERATAQADVVDRGAGESLMADVEAQRPQNAGKKNKKKFKFVPRCLKWKKKREKRVKLGDV